MVAIRASLNSQTRYRGKGLQFARQRLAMAMATWTFSSVHILLPYDVHLRAHEYQGDLKPRANLCGAKELPELEAVPKTVATETR